MPRRSAAKPGPRIFNRKDRQAREEVYLHLSFGKHFASFAIFALKRRLFFVVAFPLYPEYNEIMQGTLSTAEKGLLVARLCETGIAMMEQKLRRQYGECDNDAVQRDLREWLYRVHDKIPGDVSGPIRIRYKAP